MIDCCIDLMTIENKIQAIIRTKDDSLEREIFSVKFKILLSIYKRKMASPRELVRELCIAKSNLAMFSKCLITEGKIVGKTDGKDHRIIYYNLTKSGENYIKEKMKQMSSILFSSKSEEEQEKIKGIIKSSLEEVEKVEVE